MLKVAPALPGIGQGRGEAAAQPLQEGRRGAPGLRAAGLEQVEEQVDAGGGPQIDVAAAPAGHVEAGLQLVEQVDIALVDALGVGAHSAAIRLRKPTAW